MDVRMSYTRQRNQYTHIICTRRSRKKSALAITEGTDGCSCTNPAPSHLCIVRLATNLTSINALHCFRHSYFLLNEFTAPGYFLSILSAFTIGLLMTYFKDRRRSKPNSNRPKSKKRAGIEHVSASKTSLGISTHTACILGCMYLNAVVKGVISCFETLGIQVAQESFGMTSAYAGTVVAICGAVGVAELLMMGFITRVMSDIMMIISGMTVLIVGISGLVGLSDGPENEDWRYIFTIFMVYSIGYSLAQGAVLGMFSKVVGRVPQGELMGWFSVVGAVSRVIYPLLSGYIVYYNTIGLLCIILIATLVISIIYVLANRKEFSHLSL